MLGTLTDNEIAEGLATTSKQAASGESQLVSVLPSSQKETS